MTLLSRRVDRAGVVLDRLSRPASGSNRLPDEVADLVRDGMRLCQERDQAAGDHEQWRDLTREVYYIAGRVALELDRLRGRPVPQWKVDAVEARRAPGVPVAKRIEEMAAPEPEPEFPEAIQREIQQASDNRRAQRAALGRPSAEHRGWSELLGGRSL